MRQSNERGIALITTLLVMLLISALLVGFTTVVISDQRYRFIDRDRGQAFYAASGAMEKLTADLGNLFYAYLAPSSSQVTNLTATPPTITGVTYTASATPTPLAASELSTFHCASPKTTKTVGTNGYTIMYCADASGNPTFGDVAATIKSGAYEGLMAQKIPYQLDVTAKTATGGEVHLVRTIEGVAIPVFQFGMFSDVDLSFFAGPNFGFGGRVHTNGNLFLAQGDAATLTLSDKVTAVKEVIRQELQNGVSIDTDPKHTGIVNVAKAPGSYVSLLRTQGSLVDFLGSAFNENTWHTVSLGTTNGYIRNSRTGAKPLNLPLITVGGSNPDLIRRPPQNENNTNATLYNERLYTKASLRILLSDKPEDITNLPGLDTSKSPLKLDGDWRGTGADRPTGYCTTCGATTLDTAHPPVARSMGALAATTIAAATTAGQTTLTVNAVPAMFQNPSTITLKNSGGTSFAQATCTGRTTTTFTGCSLSGSSPASGWIAYVTNPIGSNSALLAPGNMPGSVVNPSITISGVSGSGSNKTITASTTTPQQTTYGFAANTFFLNDVNGSGASTPITCTGATTTQFTGCVGVPAASANATITSGYLETQNIGTLGGYIKMERQDTTGAWKDVTLEILNHGFSAPNLDGKDCGDPTPDAIVRIQRLRDNSLASTDQCPIIDKTNSYEHVPNSLFDTREGLLRDNAPANVKVSLGGVMYYLTIDVQNLSEWFKGVAPYAGDSGAASKVDNTGYTVYFSDRRNNRDSSSRETGDFGFEDFVNPTVADGSPNGVLDTGEDINANTLLDTYGQLPSYGGTSGTALPGSGGTALATTARPFTTKLLRAEAQVNRAIIFRRALKLVNGRNIVANINGLTVVSENPVYVQGDWNANAASDGFGGTHAATSVIADAVTLLSNNWDDNTSYTFPYSVGNRSRVTQTWYRLAIIAGKGMAFPQPTGTATDFGTDGGVHNFLRYLEDGDQPVNYQGSIATFFYNRQGVGTYKCCNTVYGAPTRNYNFDTDFLDPAKLPPNTPLFRDMNAVGFSQELRPNK
ncbi:MAG TPA: pilus assembly PilX N-terminal domain-containing protein [Vicinamibacterales bacterium]|jgi:Tfp pilus assembly protein PilX